MAEENTANTQTEQTSVELSPVEQKALAQGWVPKDQWEGDEDAWVSAREFVRAGELFEKIDAQNRTIKQIKQDLIEFGKHHARVKKVEYERALADLKAGKKEALIEGDADAVVDYDEKIALVREAQKEAEREPVQPASSTQVSPEIHPVFQAWVSRNTWYNSNKAMKAYADKIGNELGAEGKSPVDVLAAVEREVKKEFAHKFNNPNRDKPGNVEAGTNRSSSKSSSFQLDDTERRVAERLVKSGAITMEKYIEDLKAIKGVS